MHVLYALRMVSLMVFIAYCEVFQHYGRVYDMIIATRKHFQLMVTHPLVTGSYIKPPEIAGSTTFWSKKQLALTAD